LTDGAREISLLKLEVRGKKQNRREQMWIDDVKDLTNICNCVQWRNYELGPLGTITTSLGPIPLIIP